MHDMWNQKSNWCMWCRMFEYRAWKMAGIFAYLKYLDK